MKTRKSAAQIEREIAAFLYWPGGSAGGGSRRRVGHRTPVVRPHRRTSPSCRICSRFHTTAEHATHAAPVGGEPKARPAKKVRPTKKAEAAKKARAVGTPAKPNDRTSAALATVRDAIGKIGPRGRYGRDQVFISSLWRRVGGKLGMKLPEFKRWLIEQNRAERLALVRADLVDLMSPKQVEESEINDLGAQFHFVLDSAKRGK